MKIFFQLDEIEECNFPIVTIGTFDGVHLGHQKLIQHLLQKKKKLGGTTVLVTFEPHPQSVISNKKIPIFLLTTLDEKLQILKQLGLDCVLVLSFAQPIANMQGDKFVEKILVEKIGAKDIVVGYDHAFGKERSGNIETLKLLSKHFGYAVNVVEPMVVNGEVVKSTTIRRYLLNGEIERANELLGRRYCLTGRVIGGTKRGRILNFPTANLQLNNTNKLVPGDGVYAVLVNLQNKLWKGIANIGTRPTFQETPRTIEVHIIDFQKDIYDQKLQLEFVQKLRNEKKFASAPQLIQQLEQDKQKAIELFKRLDAN